MIPEITFKLDGLENFSSFINGFRPRLAEYLTGPTIKTTVGEALVARARRTIKEGGMGLTPPWAPIKKSTVDSRWNLEQKKKPANRVNKAGIVSNAPLQRTGVGMQSLNYAISGDGILLSAIRYMGWQQTGTKPYTINPKTKKALAIPGLGVFKHVHHPGIPARPFFVVFPEDIEDIKAMIVDDISALL